jgi:hypothetical protein
MREGTSVCVYEEQEGMRRWGLQIRYQEHVGMRRRELQIGCDEKWE